MNFLEGIITGRTPSEAPAAAVAAAAAAAAAESRQSAPAALQQPPEEEASEAAEVEAVAAIEADLQVAFDEMHVVEERLSSTQPELKPPSAALLKFGESISTVVQRNKLVSAFAKKHYEQEGSDALLFDTVPDWIQFTRISGYRYRMVRAAHAQHADPLAGVR